MSTTDFYADLIRRAEVCDGLADTAVAIIRNTVPSACHSDDDITHDIARSRGMGRAYRHAAELLRGAVAAAVEEEREAIADLVVRRVAGYEGESVADAIRARGESPRGDAASGGREGAE